MPLLSKVQRRSRDKSAGFYSNFHSQPITDSLTPTLTKFHARYVPPRLNVRAIPRARLNRVQTPPQAFVLHSDNKLKYTCHDWSALSLYRSRCRLTALISNPDSGSGIATEVYTNFRSVLQTQISACQQCPALYRAKRKHSGL